MTYFLWALVVIFGLITVLTWWMGRSTYTQFSWDIRLDVAAALDEVGIKGPPATLHLRGSSFPTRLYIDESCIITLQGSSTWGPDVVFDVPRGEDVQIELLAPAFEIDGDRQQRKHIPQTGGNVAFRWGITPKKSDLQEIVLALSWLDESERAYEIGAKTHTVKVVELCGLTAKQRRLLTGLAAAVTLLLTAVDLIYN